MGEEKKGRTTAIISYITIVGCLIALTMNMEPKNSFARFHIRQAFGVHVMYHALAIVLTFTNIAQAALGLYFLYLVLALYGFFGAINSKKQLLPLIGAYFQKWFTFIP
ncbi:hypothetical protein HME9304_03008 [Flagellimonas maritima]|uniref:DUF4870 domain-containing protein n=1 Tax=Flagellimonas maritima TaxID=1383885 RepID=A0A2Z4LVY5_9FLAO|nr:hypothetical protein [Allomuricauda aurantiaca]AWX45976.1 hypothetical protein HME9304_03008 [Allomuricauda aurantiaca]